MDVGTMGFTQDDIAMYYVAVTTLSWEDVLGPRLPQVRLLEGGSLRLRCIQYTHSCALASSSSFAMI